MTPRPTAKVGPSASSRDAAVLVEDGRITWVGAAAHATEHVTRRDEREDQREGDEHRGIWDADVEVVDAGGRAVIPGFVDSHTHLVFGGDRADEFAARMAGQRYAAGGIRSTVAATRAATDDELRARLATFVAELHAQGTTTFEIKSGYGLSVADEQRLVRLAPRSPTRSHSSERMSCPGVRRAGDDGSPARAPTPTSTSSSARCSTACAPHARWVDAFCERGAFTPEQSPPGARGRRAPSASACACTATSSATVEGVRLAVDLDAASVDHCTYLSDADVAALAGSNTVATLLPGVEFSTRQPYPDARRLIDAGVTVALASDCNPGSSFTSSMPFCIAVAVRDMGMTPAEAVWASTAGGAAALRRTDVGVLKPGARADLVLLDAPSHVHLAYRPGVPMVSSVWRDGAQVA